MQDYSLTLRDNTGREAKIYITGQAITEAIANGVPEFQAFEDCESGALWHAIDAGLIDQDCFLVGGDDRPSL